MSSFCTHAPAPTPRHHPMTGSQRSSSWLHSQPQPHARLPSRPAQTPQPSPQYFPAPEDSHSRSRFSFAVPFNRFYFRQPPALAGGRVLHPVAPIVYFTHTVTCDNQVRPVTSLFHPCLCSTSPAHVRYVQKTKLKHRAHQLEQRHCLITSLCMHTKECGA